MSNMSDTLLISEFERPCRWFNSAGYCDGGIVHDAHSRKMVMLEGTPVFCPVCDGQGYLLTKLGEQFMDMIWRRLQGRMYAAIREVVDKKDRE